MSFFQKVFGDANARYLKALQPIVERINALEPELQALDADQLRGMTVRLRERLAAGETLDGVLPHAFAAVREASRRTLGQRHYDVQLIGGMVLHSGQVAEMRTGEGKTLVATLAIYLNALEGKGAHLVTVNDYLARRDSVWMGQVYHALGMTVGCLQHQSSFRYREPQVAEGEEAERDRGVRVDMDYLEPVTRAEAYRCDITYGTNNEFGFDYLRDNMVQRLADAVQRPLHYAIVDEVDSILIDEARTPLIISAPAEEPTERYYQFASLVRTLRRGADYEVDEKLKSATLTEEGMERVEKALGGGNIYETQGIETVHHLEQALRAEALYHRDREYVVRDGEVIIVDEFTGRMMLGRRFSEGLHQAIEAKENVKIQRESITLATITIQNYFRLYQKLSGMTGTAITEAEEFHKIYSLDVTVVPTHRPIVRQDLQDRIYRSGHGKYAAVVADIAERHGRGQPLLIGTASIDHNEQLSELLTHAGVPHEVLNAKNHEREAQIIAQAGRRGAVTVATNMAGRGVDIILGGNPADAAEAAAVRELGGLHVIGTERHESRRIDNQLRGRAGRQGDPGSSQFYLSLEDDLMRIFGSERLKGIMATLKVPEDIPIESKLVSKSIESAQKRVEGHNFDIRKHLVEYDDVINKHRDAIYRRRRRILELAEGERPSEEPSAEEAAKLARPLPQTLREAIVEAIDGELEQLVNVHVGHAAVEPSPANLVKAVAQILPLTPAEQDEVGKLAADAEQVTARLKELGHARYEQLEAALRQASGTAESVEELERRILLRAYDVAWIDHLQAVDQLRTGIGLRGYGQRDPLVEYKQEGYRLFGQLQGAIRTQIAWGVFRLGQAAVAAASPMEKAQVTYSGPSESGQASSTVSSSTAPRDAEGHKVGRNDPCPCGAVHPDGRPKKFKHCHGR